MKDFSGVFTALITPFFDGEVDWKSLKKLLRFQLEGNVNGLVVCGTTGESTTLSYKEKKELFAFVKAEVAGQIPLVMGTGSNSTSETIESTRAAADWGADAALVVVPYYNKPPQRGLFQHFQKVSECSDLPVILYNVPSRTITKLELDTIVELSRLTKIIGIKEASGDLAFGKQIVDNCGADFLVTSGDDGTFLQLVCAGAKGVISVASNILPRQFAEWCDRTRKGDRSTINDFTRYTDLNSYLYVEANPIPVKTALYQMGLIASPELRLPLAQLSEPNAVVLRHKLEEVGLVERAK